jgi:hypothetical protein
MRGAELACEMKESVESALRSTHLLCPLGREGFTTAGAEVSENNGGGKKARNWGAK